MIKPPDLIKVNFERPLFPTHIFTVMEAEGKSSLMWQTRKRSSIEPQEPRAKRRPAGTAAVVENIAVAVSMHPRPRQLEDGIASSSSASDGQSSAVDSTYATGVVIAHVCGHCQKQFRSPSKLAQHERVHAKKAVPFYCSFCPKQFTIKRDVTRHERTHTGERPYACSMCPRRFTSKGDVPKHERTHTGENA